ncbi:MAG: hypothetical protein BVN33_08100, partial [Proteobacteria bacterium ST_bin13]
MLKSWAGKTGRGPMMFSGNRNSQQRLAVGVSRAALAMGLMFVIGTGTAMAQSAPTENETLASDSTD